MKDSKRLAMEVSIGDIIKVVDQDITGKVGEK